MIKVVKFFSLPFITTLFTLLLLTVSIAGAQEKEASSGASVSPVDSFDLFWPLVSGKTESDTLYSLKLLKETISGWIIFGDTKKADYAILLGTKRVLEAEKLLNNGKTDLAGKALDRAIAQYSLGYDLAKQAHSKGKFSAKEVRRDRLINIKRLIDYLKTTAPEEVAVRLEETKNKADALLRDYLAKVKIENLISDGLHW